MQKFILRKQVREKYGVLAEIYYDIELMESDQKEFIIDYRAMRDGRCLAGWE